MVDGKINHMVETKSDILDGTITVDNDCFITYDLSNKTYAAIKPVKNKDTTIEKCTKTVK